MNRLEIETIYKDPRLSHDDRDVAVLKPSQIDALTRELGDDWQVIDYDHLFRRFIFPDFRQALAFANDVGALAEKEGHHPDIFLGWGKVDLSLRTHSEDALTERDFILASKISHLSSAQRAETQRRASDR